MLPAFLISALLGIALWFSGAREREVQRGILIALGVLVSLTLALCGQREHVRGSRWDWRWGGPCLALLALLAVQALNASHHYLPDCASLVPQSHVVTLPRSVDRGTTVWAGSLFLGYMAAFWLARVWLVDRRARLTFVLVQVGVAAAMAILVIVQRSHPPPGALYPATGAFINRNHYAAYANVVLALALLWGLERVTSGGRRNGSRAVGWLLWLAAGVLGLSVLRCGSRLGTVVCGLIVLATLGAGLARLREHKRIVLAAAVLAAGVWFALAPARQLTGGGLASATRFSQQLLANVSGRFDGQQVGDNLSSRWKVNRAVLAMAADRWATGMGAGTFALAFPYYQPRSIPGFFLHAHNEYLQGLVEIGVLGMALFAWMAYGMFARRVAATAHEGLARWEYWGLMLALGGLSVHALTDFPLRLPAVSLLAASLIGMGGGVSRGDSPLPSNHE